MKNKPLSVISVCLALIQLFACTSYVNAQQCRIFSSYVDLADKGPESSGVFQVSKFDLKFDDDEFTKHFEHAESGLRIFVAGRLSEGDAKKEPSSLSLKLAFDGDADDTYDSLDGVEAHTTFDKNWKWLAVNREIEVKNRIYSFTFECSRSKKY